MKRFCTGWIADVHLGTQAGRLLEYLREYELEALYVVGDLIAVSALHPSDDGAIMPAPQAVAGR